VTYENIDFTRGYVRRTVDADLDDLFPQLPAILLDGPKGVGKTRTASERAVTIRRLDVASQRAILEADPMVIAGDPPPLLIDEWQRVPESLDAVRQLVDTNPGGQRVLLTGSAIPPRGTHSGAGRITTMRVRPLALHERIRWAGGISLAALLEGDDEVGGRTDVMLRDYIEEIVTGGFPGMRSLSGRALAMQLDSYLDRIADHDLPELGLNVRHPPLVRSWLRAYAAAISTTTSFEKVRVAATADVGGAPAKTTVMPYVELLTQMRVLDPVPAWQPSHNHLSTLTIAPKHHLADPALAARLVRLSASKLVAGQDPTVPIPRDGTYLGALFESLATLSIRVAAQASDARVYHLRDRGGRHEVDLIVEGDDGVVAFEVKLSSTVRTADVRHLAWLRDRIGADFVAGVVITAGPEAYRRPDGFLVVPLALLGP